DQQCRAGRSGEIGTQRGERVGSLDGPPGGGPAAAVPLDALGHLGVVRGPGRYVHHREARRLRQVLGVLALAGPDAAQHQREAHQSASPVTTTGSSAPPELLPALPAALPASREEPLISRWRAVSSTCPAIR